MKLSKVLSFGCAALMSVSLFACSGTTAGSSLENSASDSIETVVYPEGYTVLKADKSDTGAKTEGLAVEFEPHFFNYEQAMRADDRYFNDVDPEVYWNLVKERLQKLNIARFRVMIKPGWLEPYNDDGDHSNIDWSNFTFDSVEMKAVYRVLDLAEELGIKVTLVLWGVEVNYNDASNEYKTDGTYWMVGNNKAGNWCIGAKGEMIYEFVENFSALVQYCVNRKGYTCVDQVTPGNEPDWQWQVDSTRGDPDAYVEMCQELDRRFKVDGIRDKVAFNLGDSTDTGSKEWLTEVCPDLVGIADVINTHTYIFHSGSTNTQMLDWVRQNRAFAASIGASYWVGEFGSYPEGNDDVYGVDGYKRCVGLARQVVNFLNGGAVGASYWMCADSALYYTKRDVLDSYSLNGLWATYKYVYDVGKVGDAVPEDFYLRKQYYMYELLSTNIKADCTVNPLIINNEYIAGVLLTDTQGEQTLILVNNSDVNAKYAFNVSDTEAGYMYRLFEENCFVGGTYQEKTADLSVVNGCISFEAPAQSISVIKKS